MISRLAPRAWVEAASPQELHLLAFCYERVLDGDLNAFLDASDVMRKHVGGVLPGLLELTELVDQRADADPAAYSGRLALHAAVEAAAWAALALDEAFTFAGLAPTLLRPWEDLHRILSLRADNGAAASVLEALMAEDPSTPAAELELLARATLR